MDEQKSRIPSFGRVLVQLVGYFVLVGTLLFGVSGQLDWTMAWVYLFVLTMSSSVNIYYVVRVHPGLVAERMKFTKAEGIKSWDKVLSPVMAFVGPMVVLIVTAQWGCMLLVVMGSALSSWAIAHNRFFSSVVRIQKDREHTVIDSGPYRFIRHPGYGGSVLYYIAVPLALGSLWGLLPAALTASVTLIRTELEDRILKSELDGYVDYSKRVRYRLLPGLW
jgi:protein-S-isoprenylcysteine O-methyltransferase Ste14